VPEVFPANSRSLEVTSATCLRAFARSAEFSITKSAYLTFSSNGICERMRASICSSDKTGARPQTLLLYIRRAGHDDDLVVILVGSDLDHQRCIDYSDAVRILCAVSLSQIPLTLNDCGMDDPVQFCPGLRVTENDFSKNLSIDGSVGREDVFTKSLNMAVWTG